MLKQKRANLLSRSAALNLLEAGIHAFQLNTAKLIRSRKHQSPNSEVMRIFIIN
jgi:hypothetical protein